MRLLGAHSLGAALSELVASAPLIAALVGALAGLALLQLGVLAACTRGVRSGAP